VPEEGVWNLGHDSGAVPGLAPVRRCATVDKIVENGDTTGDYLVRLRSISICHEANATAIVLVGRIV